MSFFRLFHQCGPRRTLLTPIAIQNGVLFFSRISRARARNVRLLDWCDFVWKSVALKVMKRLLCSLHERRRLVGVCLAARALKTKRAVVYTVMLLYLATGAKAMLIIRALAVLFLPGCARAASVAFPTPPQQIESAVANDGTLQVYFEATTLRMHSAASENIMFDYGQGATRGRLRARLTRYYHYAPEGQLVAFV